ncbi:hypothetical protein QFZ77_005441 [Paenibacillus sp. V4I3]|uniref:hypothetical protein n=1 Tax=Paenibacillus sp. V4I3 TaxID=3042305 RepID=UPI002785F1F9|nr:hypothetical protein [Paenibacillus sp. V4I3]MDQ0876782.1 hypothetical protein [Paenibacillus sp. V4I3]
MQVLISFEKDRNENFIVHYSKQSIVVLPGAFMRLADVNKQTVVGSVYVEYSALPDYGFIQEPVVSIRQEKKVEDMTLCELWKVLEHEGIQIHSA